MGLIKGVYQSGCGRDHKSSKRLASNHSQLLGSRPELEIHLQIRKQEGVTSFRTKALESQGGFVKHRSMNHHQVSVLTNKAVKSSGRIPRWAIRGSGPGSCFVPSDSLWSTRIPTGRMGLPNVVIPFFFWPKPLLSFPRYLLARILLSLGFPGGSVIKHVPVRAGNMGLIPGERRSHVPQSN